MSAPKQQYMIDGKVVSKNAWKKHQKQLKSKQKKAKKPGKTGGKVSEKNLSPNQYFEIRKQMIDENESKGIDMYPHKFQINISLPQFIETYQNLKNEEYIKQKTVSLAGRLITIRSSSKKLKFYVIQADGETLQVLCSLRECANEDVFYGSHEHIRRGDIIGVTGYPGRTRTGELSIFAKETKLLSPCLRMLPASKGKGLTSQDTRYRQRYLDLILNKSSRNVFLIRSKIISYVRRFLESRGFIEVETPILNQQPGGATAKPFKTYHNELKIPMYLRIAPELYLKELIVGGLDRVFEIGRLFRNEGIDMTHNPEFTTCEFYAAYWDYNDLMDTTEEMLSGMVKEICGDTKIKYNIIDDDGKDKELTIDFTRPWQRMNMVDELEKRMKKKIPRPFESKECRDFLVKCCDEFNVDCGEPRTTARLLDKLVDHFIESTLINPTFLMCHPEIMSPLAKYHRNIKGLTERFELFVAGKELINAYTELNNPKVQRQKFSQQAQDVAEGDDEAMKYDEDFCVALEYGLPPTAGWGMGIDRLTMFLTNNNTIKEVLLFPQMKPDENIQKPNNDDIKTNQKVKPKPKPKKPVMSFNDITDADYFVDCEDERIVEGKTARVTTDEAKLRQLWEECDLGPINDLKPYCGCIGKITEIEDDDQTLKLRWENYDEFYIPVKACYDARGAPATLPSVLNSWLGDSTEQKQAPQTKPASVDFSNITKADYFVDCEDERIVEGSTARVTTDKALLRKLWEECDLGPINDLSPYCGCIGKIVEIEDDDQTLKLRWENYDEFYIPVKACYDAKGSPATLPAVLNSWLGETKQEPALPKIPESPDFANITDADYFVDCEDERIVEGKTARVTTDEAKLRQLWEECDLGPINDLKPYCGCIGKITEIEDDDQTLKLRWENYDEFYIPVKACYDAKGASATLPAVQNSWLK